MWIEISWTQIYDYNLIHDGIIYSFIILVYGHEMQLSIIVDVLIEGQMFNWPIIKVSN